VKAEAIHVSPSDSDCVSGWSSIGSEDVLVAEKRPEGGRMLRLGSKSRSELVAAVVDCSLSRAGKRVRRLSNSPPSVIGVPETVKVEGEERLY
jgi:hypothetical protein